MWGFERRRRRRRRRRHRTICLSAYSKAHHARHLQASRSSIKGHDNGRGPAFKKTCVLGRSSLDDGTWGFYVSSHSIGALVSKIDPGTPAARSSAIHVGSYITAIGGRDVRDKSTDFIGAILKEHIDELPLTFVSG